MDTAMITLVVLVNVLFLGVLIWKAAWLMRKIRGYPVGERRTGGDGTREVGGDGKEAVAASVAHEHGADHGLGGQADTHEKTDKQQ